MTQGLSKNELVQEELSKTVDGVSALNFIARNGKASNEMSIAIKGIFASNNLTASEMKGFLEYMKYCVDSSSYIRQEKQQ